VIRSMTGFGEAERQTDVGRLRLEIRTVNHRFLNFQFRTPPGFDRLEPEIQGWLRPFLARGHVKFSLTLETERGPGAEGAAVDLERARAYRDALLQLRDELGIPGEVDLAMLARFGEIFRVPREEPEDRLPIPVEMLREACEEAARGVVAMRAAEGSRLLDDLRERLAAIEEALDGVALRAPERLVTERDRLREAIRVLADGVGVDEERIAREVAHLAERWDINEEIVRFRSHVALFREALGTPEPAGKRLGFLVQEMHREANTIGSKANDAAVAGFAMALKEEVERLREQLENVE